MACRKSAWRRLRAHHDVLFGLQLTGTIFRAVHYVPSCVIVDYSQWNGVDGDNKKRKGGEQMQLAQPWIFAWGIALGAVLVLVFGAIFGKD
jgi:hypothetical protein